MIYGVIGAGLMGSSLIQCLVHKGYQVIVYNRTRKRAEKICRELGCKTVDSPVSMSKSDVIIIFVFDDRAVEDIVLSRHGLIELRNGIPIINASTITPAMSLWIARILGEHQIPYFEGPVYGSVDELKECRVLSILAGDNVESVEKYVREYSSETIYAGSIPKAMALKLALNNIGLSLPPIIGESLAILEAYDIETSLFEKILEHLWFGALVKRYLARIKHKGKTRFTVKGAAKDYHLITTTLYSHGYPAIVSTSLKNFYTAALHKYGEEDYPRAIYWLLKKIEEDKK